MSKTKLYNVIFQPDGINIKVPAGTLISKAATNAGIPIEAPCGGIGVCGKCRVKVRGLVSEPDNSEMQILGEELVKDGVRLSCITKITGDCTVEIPEESKSVILKILKESNLRNFCISSGISKTYFEISPPTLEDERAAFERISDCLSKQNILVIPNLNIIKSIQNVLSKSDYKVTLTLANNELVDLETGNHTQEIYGIAFDVGSTTIVGYLINLTTGNEICNSALMNPQMIYGDDLIARISFSETQKNGLRVLQKSIVGALNKIVSQLVKQSKISARHIYKTTVVGNTCMSHILLGINITSLGQSPYVPSICSDLVVSASTLGLKISPEAKVLVLPNIAGFVGSDLVGVLLANMCDDDGSTRLAVDIGTNGEMALRHNNKIFVCSAAAGPAFEGSGIRCGMRGQAGAIDSVVIDDDVHYNTIYNNKPIGICGSGLVDAVAQMLNAKIIDSSGRLISPDEASTLTESLRNRIIQTDEGIEFVLAYNKDTENGKAIVLTSKDIRLLQLAKGSIHAAIQTLIQSAGASDEDIGQILLAGAFGNYIRVESAIRIGLIPAIEREKVISIGNAAGSGSKLALICEAEMQLARNLAKQAKHIELATSPYYQIELMERMLFPEN